MAHVGQSSCRKPSSGTQIVAVWLESRQTLSSRWAARSCCAQRWDTAHRMQGTSTTRVCTCVCLCVSSTCRKASGGAQKASRVWHDANGPRVHLHTPKVTRIKVQPVASVFHVAWIKPTTPKKTGIAPTTCTHDNRHGDTRDAPRPSLLELQQSVHNAHASAGKCTAFFFFF
mgnify:CR=1 FL=1